MLTDTAARLHFQKLALEELARGIDGTSTEKYLLERARDLGLLADEAEKAEATVRDALLRALPLLIKLGDYHGNADGRCETILAVRAALELVGVPDAEQPTGRPEDAKAECEGHPAGPNDPMGETVYCDGSCTKAEG